MTNLQEAKSREAEIAPTMALVTDYTAGMRITIRSRWK
jgi:hypothetical protein